MTWDYFCTVFNCRPALLGEFGAFAAWRGKKTVCCWWAYLDRTCYLLLLYCWECGFLWASAYADHGRRRACGTLSFFHWQDSSHTAVGGISGYSVLVLFLSLVFICINIFKPEIHNKTLMPALQSPWFCRMSSYICLPMLCWVRLP